MTLGDVHLRRPALHGVRLPQDGRPPAGPVPDRHFCHVVRDTATLNLRPLLAYADAAVARYYAGRPGVGREPAWQEARHPDGHCRRRHLRRVLVSHPAATGAEEPRHLQPDVGRHHVANRGALPGLHELVCQPDSVRLLVGELPQGVPQVLLLQPTG